MIFFELTLHMEGNAKKKKQSVIIKLLTLIFVKDVIYMILHIWQAFRLLGLGTTFVRKVCLN